MSKKSKSYKKFKFWEGAEGEEQPKNVDASFFQEAEGLPDSKLAVKKNNDVCEKKTTYPDEIDCGDYKELIQNIKAAKGSQWKILEYFAERSLETGSLSTGHFKISKLAKQTGLEGKTIYTAIYRLERQKKLIIRQKGKEGSGGSSRFMFASEDIKNQILCSRDKIISNQLNVSSIDNTTNVGIGWGEVNIDLLSEIGFNQKHVLQLRNYSTPQIVQESIRHFAFGLQNNAKTQSYKDPIAVLVGVLRKGEAWIESAYKSPQEIAIEKLLAQKKAENIRLQQLDERLQDEYFVEWSKNLTEEQTKAIIGDKVIGPKSLQEKSKTGLLKEHFQVNEWAKLKKSILGN